MLPAVRRTLAGLGLCVAVVVGATPTAGAQVEASVSGSTSFTTVGSHSFTVPCGVTTLTVDAYGARGGLGDNFGFGGTNTGGLGGRALAGVTVTPGETLTVVVGGHGGDVQAPAPLNIGGAGGSNGGGDGGSQTTGAGYGGGGGGMSNVDRAATHLVVAGGGGGGGGSGLVPAGGTMTDGVEAANNGDGKVLLSYTQGPCTVSTGCGSAVLSTSAGVVEDLQAQSLPSTPAPPSGAVFPCGLISFRITGLTAGATVTATITPPVPVDKWYKLQNGAYTELASTVSGSSISVALTDGGAGDSDGVANGVIVDPTALAQLQGAPTPSPAAVVATPNFTG